jgi:NFACT protein RNA binding domain
MLPVLNWRELARLVELMRPKLVGSHLDRLVIAERPEFPQGYLKNEWVLRLQDRKHEQALWVSLRPRACFVSIQAGKGPRHAASSTRSPFDQALSKILGGRRITGIRAIHRERLIVIEFGDSHWLVIALIPALPEAFVLEAPSMRILARSRTIREPSKVLLHWKLPEEGRAVPELALREELVGDLEGWHGRVEAALEEEARQQRREHALRIIREKRKALLARIGQSEQELSRAGSEPDWGALGELLKSRLHELPEPCDGHWVLDEKKVPCKEGLTPRQQLERIFGLSRRKRRRIDEATHRLADARTALERLEFSPELSPELSDDAGLVELERAAGVARPEPGGPRAAAGRGAGGGVPARWTGKAYFSRDGFAILAGKSKDENLELTFKIARGNDLWMHVRGRPGAHVLVPVPSGKSVPLETLLDAAQLVLFFSGGKNWGKTEVDYTFKKHVRRIKDSSEASYTQNKTLIVAPDPERLERLLRSS